MRGIPGITLKVHATYYVALASLNRKSAFLFSCVTVTALRQAFPFSICISTACNPHLSLKKIVIMWCRSDKLVSSTLVSSLSLHNPLPRWAHAYILPFIPLYPIFGAIWLFKYDEYIGSEEWTFVYLGSIITLNALAWLFVQWSVTFEALFTATKVSHIGGLKEVLT